MAQSTGIVELAGTNKFGSYVKIGGNFFNAGKGLTFNLASLQKGQTIVFDHVGKYINSVKVDGSAPVAATPTFPMSDKKNIEIARSTAVKSVLGSPMVAQMYKNKDVSEAISDSKLLVEQFTNYIVTGEWTVSDVKETVNA